MNKLSKEAEDRLLSAIEKTAAFVNTGMAPNDAIVKAAQEDNVPVGHVRLMVHAYNTGRTTRQRADGADVLEKSADFDIADADTVMARLCPAQVKTAAAQQREEVVSTVYQLSPRGLLERRAASELRKSAAAVDWSTWAGGRPTSYEEDPTRRMQRAYCDAERLQRKTAEARRVMAAARDRMAADFTELADFFRRPDAPALAVVRGQADMMLGEKAAQVLDELIAVFPELPQLPRQKRAHYEPDRLAPVSGEAFSLLSQFLDGLDSYKAAKAAYEKTARDNHIAAEEMLRPFADAPQSVLDEPEFSTTDEKTAAFPTWLWGTELLSRTYKNLADVGGKSSPVAKAQAKLTDPGHEQALRNVQAAATLQDLMLNDPVLGGHDPDEVMRGFNEIMELAPHASGSRGQMQALLRKRMEQGVFDPFEVDQILSMEQKQQKMQQPLAAGGSVKEDDSVL